MTEGLADSMLEMKLTDPHLKNWYLANVIKVSDKVKSLAQHTVVYFTSWCRDLLRI
jgi:hypothetical protein